MKKNALLIFMAALLLLQVYTLLIPPVTGIQDSGQLYDTLSRNGLYRMDTLANFDMVYGVESNLAEASTVPIPLVKILSGLFAENLFFVNILAILYIILFDIGVYLAFRKMNFSTPWLKYVLMAAVLLVFGDKGYLAYFNSLTYEGAALSYFALLVGAAVHYGCSEKKKVWNLLLVALAAFLFAGTAKPMFWLIFPCVLLLVRFGFSRKEAWHRALSILLTVLVLAGNTALFQKGEVRNSHISRYEAVFYGVMKDASPGEVEEAIAWFGLPEGAAELAGTTFYSETSYSQEEKTELANTVSYGRVAGYYAAHPKALYRLATSSVANSFFVQQDYLAYSEWNDAAKPAFGIWNTLKRVLPIQSVFMMVGVWIVLIVVCVRYRKEGALLYDTGLWLLLCGLSSFGLPVTFFGFAQISKTVFPFALVTDMVILFVLAWGIETLMLRQKRVKEKYGITQ